jgi:exodeoxyribonuclease VII large subunit
MQSTFELTQSPTVISVAELNRLARVAIESRLPLMWIAGEISNYTAAASGHCYFSLKDAQAQVRCVMFRQKLQFLGWRPTNGMQVEVRATPSFYEPRGEFQLNIEVMRRSGRGALYEAYEQLKAKLQAQGLFDPAAKKPLPRFPRAIGIITSLQAAALRDVITTLKRCMPSIPVIVYPAAVQGQGAAQQIVSAIGAAHRRAECDVLILCRGGGSIEDLWAFNEEAVARAIFACRLPIVTGIGHETDFTIADFVADVRAPTPTGAARLAAPNCEELSEQLRHLHQRLRRVTERAIERRMQQLDGLERRLVHPGQRIAQQLADLGHLAQRLRSAWREQIQDGRWQLRELAQRLVNARPNTGALFTTQRALAHRLISAANAHMKTLRAELKSLALQLEQLNPQAVIDRGYSMVETASGEVVRDSAQIEQNQDLKITFARGWARTRVEEKG